MSKIGTCGTCNFFSQNNEHLKVALDLGSCNCMPPQMILVTGPGGKNGMMPIFPQVKKDISCGQYQPRLVQPPAGVA